MLCSRSLLVNQPILERNAGLPAVFAVYFFIISSSLFFYEMIYGKGFAIYIFLSLTFNQHTWCFQICQISAFSFISLMRVFIFYAPLLMLSLLLYSLHTSVLLLH